jgi:uncharacterized damage-inducible protein DinB
MKKLFILLIVLAPITVFGQFQKDLAGMVKMNSEKVISLAEAIPEDRFDWSPADGVRDVKGVLLHIIGANYFFPTLAGAEMPEGIDPSKMDENISGKKATIKVLKDSYAHLMKAINEVPDDKMNESFDFYGTPMTVRQALMLAYGHCEEHMGQLIAYARSNNIAPPWSQTE